jgi:hypothetical protein
MRFYLPQRQMAVRLLQEAMACGELKRVTDPELLIDALYGPLYYRWLMGHVPWTRASLKLLLTCSFQPLRPT